MTFIDVLKLAAYFAFGGIASHIIGDALPRDAFNPNGWFFRGKPFEKDGVFYERLGIRRWKDKMPEKSRVVKYECSKTITSMHDMGHIARLIMETCVAEAVHLALIIAAFFLPLLVRGPALVIGWILAILFNLPCLLIQRYNRPRLAGMFRRMQSRSKKEMRVLILSCDVGGGHNSAAYALMEEFKKRNIPCAVADMLSVQSKFLSKVVSKAHSAMYIRAPRLFGIGYDYVNRHDKMDKKPGFIRKGVLRCVRLKNYIHDNGFNVLIMPHVLPAAAVCAMEDKLPPDIVTGFIATDYSCGPFIGGLDVHLYFIPHADLRREFIDKGVPPEKIVASGIPVSARFRTHADKADARERLSLPLEGPILLIMTGSMGCGAVVELVGQLRAMDATKVIICGKNADLKATLDHDFSGDTRIVTTGFTDKVDLYMDAADVLITKGGGLSTTEAAVKGIPMVHLDAIPGLESRNLAFFSARGMSLIGGNTEEAVKSAMLLLNEPARREEMIRMQRQYIAPEAAEKVCDALCRQFASIPERRILKKENVDPVYNESYEANEAEPSPAFANVSQR